SPASGAPRRSGLFREEGGYRNQIRRSGLPDRPALGHSRTRTAPPGGSAGGRGGGGFEGFAVLARRRLGISSHDPAPYHHLTRNRNAAYSLQPGAFDSSILSRIRACSFSWMDIFSLRRADARSISSSRRST